MKSWIALAFPYLCALFVVGLIGWDQYAARSVPASMIATKVDGRTIDPVCYMDIGPGISSTFEGIQYAFCSDYCKENFDANPVQYTTESCIV